VKNLKLCGRGLVASLLALAFGAGAAHAALVPLGGEIQVNTTTAEYQSSPDVAMDGAGNFVVVWMGGEFLGNRDIFAQRYDASGTPLGNEFQVNTFTSGAQAFPQVAMDADGDFVVVWKSDGQFPPSISSIIGRRFDNTGAPVGEEFLISDELNAFDPNVAMEADGDFLVAWNGAPVGGDFFAGNLYTRLYDSAGTPRTSSVPLVPLSPFAADTPGVTATPGGDWIVAWLAVAFDFSRADTLAQRLDADGNRVGPEVVVQVPPNNGGQDTCVAAGSDRIVVSWQDNAGDGSVHARLFDGGFAPLSGDLLISTFTGVVTQEPDCAMDGDGNFVVSWTEREETNPSRDGSGATVMARAFDLDGNPVGAEIVVNTTAPGFQTDAHLAMSPDGRLAVAWRGPRSDDSSDVFAQVYVPNTTPEARCRNLTVSAGPSCTAGASIDNASFDPDGADSITLAQSPAGPYALGATSVTLTVTDNHGAASSCTGTVTVIDATPPAISCPAAITTGGNQVSNGAVVPFTVSATDSCDTSVGVAAVPPSGSLFPFGTTTVSATATDDSGNNASCSFTVTVLSPQDQIGSLIDEINALVSGGALAPNKANPLITKLEGAAAKLDAAQTGAACSQLGAFINQVNAYIGNGTLTAAQGQELIDATNAIRANLGC
jgi:hypothetical protein